MYITPLHAVLRFRKNEAHFCSLNILLHKNAVQTDQAGWVAAIM
jgi:hypothetical protein